MKYLKYFISFSFLWLLFVFSIQYMVDFIFDARTVFNFLNSNHPIVGWVYILFLMIFPLLLSYWILLRVQSFKKARGGLSSRIKIPLSLLSVFVLWFLFIFVLSGVHYSKTDLVIIDEKEEFGDKATSKENMQEDNEPENYKSFTRNIGSNVYELKEEGSEQVVYLYEDGERLWDAVIPLNMDRLDDFYFDSTEEVLVILEGVGYAVAGDQYELISFINLPDQNQVDEGAINLSISSFMFTPGMYSGSKILDYLDSQEVLLRTSGGDGCGGWGRVWKVNNLGNINVLTEIGAGCITDPRYVLYQDNTIFFASVNNSDENIIRPLLTELYSLNPITLERKSILNLNNLSEEVTYFKLEGDIISFYSPDKEEVIYRYNIQTRQFIN